MIKQVLIVGLGGGCGSILRYLTSVFTAKQYTGSFPLSTFVVNILGCIVIGLLIGLSERNQIISPDLKLLLITGFCGGYTTFSTFSAENFNLMQNGNYVILAMYVLTSTAIGLLAVYVGSSLAKI